MIPALQSVWFLLSKALYGLASLACGNSFYNLHYEDFLCHMEGSLHSWASQECKPLESGN